MVKSLTAMAPSASRRVRKIAAMRIFMVLWPLVASDRRLWSSQVGVDARTAIIACAGAAADTTAARAHPARRPACSLLNWRLRDHHHLPRSRRHHPQPGARDLLDAAERPELAR